MTYQKSEKLILREVPGNQLFITFIIEKYEKVTTFNEQSSQEIAKMSQFLDGRYIATCLGFSVNYYVQNYQVFYDSEQFKINPT